MGDGADDATVTDTAQGDPALGDVAQDDTVEAPEMLHGVPVTRSGGQVVLHPAREDYRELIERLRAEGYWVCIDLCGVDYLTYDAPRSLPVGVVPERFEVVVGLLDPTGRDRMRIRVQVPAGEPSVQSITPIHPGAEAHEREAFDLFGIDFEGHPHLSRILLPDEWEGHPLRKDEPVGSIPVQFKVTGDA